MWKKGEGADRERSGGDDLGGTLAALPGFLTGHKAFWADWYKEEEVSLKRILRGEEVVRISHIGSTSIAGIWAKPIIDILVEVPKESNLLHIRDLLINNGYLCMSRSDHRISFNKGYTEKWICRESFSICI